MAYRLSYEPGESGRLTSRVVKSSVSIGVSFLILGAAVWVLMRRFQSAEGRVLLQGTVREEFYYTSLYRLPMWAGIILAGVHLILSSSRLRGLPGAVAGFSLLAAVHVILLLLFLMFLGLISEVAFP